MEALLAEHGWQPAEVRAMSLRDVVATLEILAERRLPRPPAASVEGEPSKPVEPPERKPDVAAEQVSIVARACALLMDYSKRKAPITQKVLAKLVGCHRSTLNRSKEFNSAWKYYKQSLTGDLPKGFRTADGQAEAEYYDPEFEDEDEDE
jgi:hypothetical protein